MLELNRSVDLTELAGSPLLLLLLLYLHIEGSVLPRHRFEAYRYLVDHLVREHPMRKRVAALSADFQARLTDDEVLNVLSFVAYLIQDKFPTGLVSENDIRSPLELFLADANSLGLGLTAQEARQHIDRLFKFAMILFTSNRTVICKSPVRAATYSSAPRYV
jgi:hypothetical protein